MKQMPKNEMFKQPIKVKQLYYGIITNMQSYKWTEKYLL